MQVAEEQEYVSKLAAETLGMARSLVMEIARFKGETPEFRSMGEMTTAEMLEETQTIVNAAASLMESALEHPMLKPMMRMLGKS